MCFTDFNSNQEEFHHYLKLCLFVILSVILTIANKSIFKYVRTSSVCTVKPKNDSTVHPSDPVNVSDVHPSKPVSGSNASSSNVSSSNIYLVPPLMLVKFAHVNLLVIFFQVKLFGEAVFIRVNSLVMVTFAKGISLSYTSNVLPSKLVHKA